ncbi:MAG: 50S ribosomal protein L23 [Candidatus Nealsonbacteria bacterium CG23_combo_of_CG06-09_8_20_14_all_37_18]|uniref:Large ribosomal subunit protein uL23 n=1 Tax=Candidatus Nealsonbacteria bacterium CG23_combo_of_CG06-09_8_20_14_all_37_18 TaxID=1974720 RepID=A0A2G9YYV8_9BACT|nr:MAG: 50S ribosomal protein L23 [Candidatus Nealsonbacteria bacterium CG23_combo_of_CG06-09_8_20_14_all_37_18]
MKILDVFKKKKRERVVEEDKSSSSSSPSLRESSIKEEKKEAKQAKPIETEVSKIKKETKIGQSYRILKIPHITEKATDLAEKNQYAFRIFPRTNKTEIKRAVENAYGVDVVSVKIINVHKKKRRLGKILGIKPGYKKAIVKIKKGQKIEVLPR